MIDFACDEAGRLTSYIADPKGEVWSYELRLVWPETEQWAELLKLLAERKYPAEVVPDWACLLFRIDTEDSYFVAHLGPARWFCECSDYKYRSHKTPDGCKHCVHARSFYGLCRIVTRTQGVSA